MIFIMAAVWKKIIALFLVISLGLTGFFLFNQTNRTSEELIVRFLDVGQGDSILIQTPAGDDILIDGGSDNLAAKKVGYYLPINDRKIELMILSHPHSDHVAGLIEIIRRYQVAKILTTGAVYNSIEYRIWRELVEKEKILVEIIDSPGKLALAGGTVLEIVSPKESLAGRRVKNLNNASIVIRLECFEKSILFTGDYEQEEELAIAPVEIYKVGHHGADNANSRIFLEKISPDYAVISVGEDNNFGHPNYRVIRNLKKLGAQVFRTDHQGDIIFSISQEGIELVDDSGLLDWSF